MLSISASSHGLPMTCNPSGKPDLSNPVGTETPGKPAKFTVTVNTSFKYICTGSASDISPKPNAAEGVVGVKIASIPVEKTLSKSSLINALTRRALL